MDMIQSNAVNGYIRLPRTQNALEVLRNDNNAPQGAEEAAPVAPAAQPVAAAARVELDNDPQGAEEAAPVAPAAQPVEVDQSENSNINVLQEPLRASGKRNADQISSDGEDEEDEPSPVAQLPFARPPVAQPNLVVRRQQRSSFMERATRRNPNLVVRRQQRSSFMDRATRRNPNLVTRSNIPARQPLEQRPHQRRLVTRPNIPARQPLEKRGTRFVSPVVMN